MGTERHGVDLLLINPSNFPGLPVFPYAFVQVSAIARRYGLTVSRLDLHGIDREDWHLAVSSAVRSSSPRMVGVHVRQADSVSISDYTDTGKRPVFLLPDGRKIYESQIEKSAEADDIIKRAMLGKNYFPVHDAKYLIDVVRSVTDLPVTVGGFGFTTHARRMVHFLEPDFGVQGEPDDFFARFDDVCQRKNLEEISNLIYLHEAEYRFGKRVFFDPSPDPEYSEQLVDELMDFYKRLGYVPFADGVQAPVEIARGCPYRCHFCTEPGVKGRTYPRKRNMAAVMADVHRLVEKGIGSIWFVCSEVNIGNNDMLFELASRMEKMNHGRIGNPVRWSAYTLPNPGLSREQMRRLLDSNFVPGWNQFVSYDDENIKRMGVPYRSRHAIKSQVDWRLELNAFQDDNGQRGRRRLEMFLGNSFVDAKAIAATLRQVDAANLADLHDSGAITRATRVFGHEGESFHEVAGEIFSIGPDGPLPRPDLLYPSFHYPRDLVERLGSIEAVNEFFTYIEQTFFSHEHRQNKDWIQFLQRTTSAEQFLSWCTSGVFREPPASLLEHVDAGIRDAVQIAKAATLPENSGSTIGEILRNSNKALYPKWVMQIVARLLVQHVISLHPDVTDELFTHLGIPVEGDTKKLSDYRLLELLCSKFSSEGELLAHVRKISDFSDPHTVFTLRYVLYQRNLIIRPDYRDILFAPSSS